VKVCSKCGESKPEVAFYKHPWGKGGLCAECKVCWRARQNAYAEANRQEVRARNRLAWHRFSALKHARACGEAPIKFLEKPVRHQGASSRAWRKANPDKVCANMAAYRATKLQATPSWASRAYVDLFYLIAKEESVRVGEEVHVDHIVPLKHPRVCGLHNEFNLQLLRASENLSKGNRTWPDM